jgi:hypothetical protein
VILDRDELAPIIEVMTIPAPHSGYVGGDAWCGCTGGYLVSEIGQLAAES